MDKQSSGCSYRFSVISDVSLRVGFMPRKRRRVALVAEHPSISSITLRKIEKGYRQTYDEGGL